VAHPRLNPSSAEVRFGKLEVSFGTYRGLRTDDCEAGSNLSRPDLRHYFRLADKPLTMRRAIVHPADGLAR